MLSSLTEPAGGSGPLAASLAPADEAPRSPEERTFRPQVGQRSSREESLV
jgi:hypothetical protein